MNAAKPESCFLLSVDIQTGFLPLLPDSTGLVRRCCFAVEAAQLLGFGVGFTEQVPEKLGTTVPELRTLAPKAPLWTKSAFSAWRAPELPADLSKSGRTCLLLAGLETSICIFQTARDALAAGIEVTVLADCVQARRPADARAALAELARLGARVLAIETVCYDWLQDAKHPQFRSFTQLVKRHSA